MAIHGELQGMWEGPNCELILGYKGSEVLTAVVMKTVVFCVIVPCSQYVNGRFGGTYHLHLQG
jgi:hypothetical protein